MPFHIRRKPKDASRIVLVLILVCFPKWSACSRDPSEPQEFYQNQTMEAFSDEEYDEAPEKNYEIKSILEEKYRFKNNEEAKRFKVATVDVEDNRPAETSDQTVAWAFRSYAARRIVGGMETSVSVYPYIVAISRYNKHWCGGSIIDEQWVLTAAHCFQSVYEEEEKRLSPYTVRAGSSFHNRGGYQARINKVFFPKKYKPGSADFDFSLLRLDRPLPIGRNIAVLNLPSKDYHMKEDDMLVVTGWGSTDETGYGHVPDRLRFVPVPLMSMSQCQRFYKFYITPRMICAGYSTGGKDACNHDSGGPAVREGILLGVVSFGGRRCGDPKSPGVYSRVSEVTAWVENTIANNEAKDDPKLIPKIKKARQREKEMQKFKSRVEEKKQKIKSWLRDTLNSPAFLNLAKQKLRSSKIDLRRFEDATLTNDLSLDNANFFNLINDKIIKTDAETETELAVHYLAVNEVLRQELASDDDDDMEAILDID